MSTAVMQGPLTTADLLAMPDDGTERWLIRGELREKPANPEKFREKRMTLRNRFHSRIMIRVGKAVDNWLDEQAEPRGQVLCGEAGVRLQADPEITFGVDVVYISAETASQQTTDCTIIEGVPILAVEILSPSDTQEEWHEKTDAYLQTGVALVWIIDPHDRTVLAYRREQPPQLFTIAQELTAEPHLPGFRVPVARLFD